MNKLQHKEMAAHNLAKALFVICKERSKTYEEIAQIAQVSRQNLHNWMKAQSYPNEYSVWLLNKEFGLTADWIFLGRVDTLPPWMARHIKSEGA